MSELTLDVSNPAPSPEEAVALKQQRALDENALRTIFLEARTANGFLDGPVPRELLERVLELTELGPTSANTLPARFAFVVSPEAKAMLKPALSPNNVAKTMAAPATAIVAADLRFYDMIPRLFPTRPELRDNFTAPDKAAFVREFARDNALLQMGYFTIAARALGLDVGPMAGFDRAQVDAAFSPDGEWISLYLINVGYADDTTSFPRLPRLDPADVARFV